MRLIDRTHGCIVCGVVVGEREQSLLCGDCIRDDQMVYTQSTGYPIYIRLEDDGPHEMDWTELAVNSPHRSAP